MILQFLNRQNRNSGKKLFIRGAYSQSNSNEGDTKDELWVLLLEKAYAKVYGGYGNIVGGSGLEALKNLTGAPTE